MSITYALRTWIDFDEFSEKYIKIVVITTTAADDD